MRLLPALPAVCIWLLAACTCGAGTATDAGVDASHDVRVDQRPDGPLPADLGWQGEFCGGSRTLSPLPFPGVPRDPTPCGPGCRQLVLGSVDIPFDFDGDLIASWLRTTIGVLIVYTKVSTGESWRIHGGFPNNLDGCFFPAIADGRIYYRCIRGYGTAARQDLVASFDPATHRETDLFCSPPGESPTIKGAVSAGSTGVLLDQVLDRQTCGDSATDVALYRFGKPGVLENLTQHCGAVFMSHMAGPYAVWTEGNKDTLADNIVVYDTRSGSKSFVSPSPKAQIMPRTDGRYVVWADSRNDPKSHFYSWSNTDIYRYDIQTGKVDLVSNNPAQQVYPDVSGKWVVWEDSRNDPTTITPRAGLAFNTDIYAKNMDTGQEVQLTKTAGDLATGRTGLELQPHVSNGRVIYRARDNNDLAGIFLIDLDVFLAAQGKP